MSLLNMLTRRTRGRSSLVDLYAPGASEGDVLTVQADGSLSPAAGGGGGSQPDAHGAYAYLSAEVDDFTHVMQTVPFDASEYDTDDYFNAVTHRFTVPVGLAGLYVVSYGLSTYGINPAVTALYASIDSSNDEDDASTYLFRNDAGAAGTLSDVVNLAEGDTVTPRLSWTTEDDNEVITLWGGLGAGNHFSLAYLGPVPA